MNIRLTRKLLLLGFFLVYLLSPFKVLAQQEPAHVLFINQVRGSECCAKGSLENLKAQVEVFTKNNIPAFFALRYDTLNDEKYVTYLKEVHQKRPDIIQLGLLIEITPQLAGEAKVKYQGSDYKWFEGQNAFTIGYTLEERKKIIDLVFSKFFQLFHFYPKLTSAWMLDTDSLNYLHNNYKVLVHQFTREQWGVDSYTLYGGPPHYPYPASKNWAFIPDYGSKNPLLIVRQAITDPLFNYGDTTNTFTSQANDYSQDKTTDYFIKLVNQAVNQSEQTGFVTLGLENSMERKYQDEYLKQINYINELKIQRKVKFPTLQELFNFWSTKKTTLYFGRDLLGKTSDEAYWITTPSYRARLRIKNNQVLLTDLRLFNSDYSDPYKTYVARKEGFWIVPYLIDGSHWYKPLQDKRSFLQRFFSPPIPGNVFPEAQKDLKTETAHISFPTLAQGKDIQVVRENNEVVKLAYQTSFQERTEIIFQQDKIIVTPADKDKVLYKDYPFKSLPIRFIRLNDGFKLEWWIGNDLAYAIQNQCENSQCAITFLNNPDLLQQIRVKQYPFLFPEPVGRELSENNTILYVHNPYAIAGRNPVRIIVMTKDIYDLPTILSQPITIQTDSPIGKISNTQDLMNKPVQYVDLYHPSPQSFLISVAVSENVTKKARVFFAPNCKNEIKYCLFHPTQTFWYLNAIIRDKIRRVILGEQQ